MISALVPHTSFETVAGDDMPCEPAVLAGEYLRGSPQASTSEKSGIPGASTFSMIPESVLIDPKLQHLDIRVYGMLACARRGSTVTLGQRQIAERLHVKRRSLTRAIARLIEANHLKLSTPTASGHRARYELTSPLFVPKVKKSESEPRAKRSRLSPTVRQARAFAINQVERATA